MSSHREAPEISKDPVADSTDPVERVAYAAEFLLRGVLSYQGAVRAMIRPRSTTGPPGGSATPGQ